MPRRFNSQVKVHDIELDLTGLGAFIQRMAIEDCDFRGWESCMQRLIYLTSGVLQVFDID